MLPKDQIDISFTEYYKKLPQKFSHHYIVSGKGGVRTDFVALWLQSLSQFNPSSAPWLISYHGGTFGTQKMFEYSGLHGGHLENQINSTIARDLINAHYDKDAKLSASKSHDSFINLYYSIPPGLHKNFTMLNVIVDSNDINLHKQIAWEYMCKTGFILTTQSKSHIQNLMKAYIPEVPEEEYNSTDDETIANCVSALLPRLRDLYFDSANAWIDSNRTSAKDKELAYIELDYEEIIKPTGGEYIQQLLDIQVSESDLKLYAINTVRATSKPNVTAFGRTWNINDI